MNQPFRVEYARSKRSKCTSCGSWIQIHKLRLGEDVECPFRDGIMTKWYHPDCFFLIQAPNITSVEEIQNFDIINLDDRNLVLEKIEEINKNRVILPKIKVEESFDDDDEFNYPECLLKDIHIYEQDGKKFSIIFNWINANINKKSYYKIQILKQNTTEKYWLFRCWGRIGTSNGDTSLKLDQLENCLKQFENCVKNKPKIGYRAIEHPDSLYFIDPSNYTTNTTNHQKIQSVLKKPVQELIRLIFDLEKDKPLNTQTDNVNNNIDTFYEVLNTNIEWIRKKSKKFQLIKKYIQNTHAKQHSHYTLEIEDAFEIKCMINNELYKPYRLSHNKKILWYGAPVADFISILTQGLTFASPKSSATDYIFGEGIYFTDVVSKAANRCCNNKQNPIGLLLLCEVALGNMHTLETAENIQKLPNRKNSIFGKGKFCPDLEKCQHINEVLVPCGPIIPSNGSKNSTLLFNDYVVHDPDRVKIRYIVRVKFNFK